MLLEDPADKYLEAEEMIENVIEDFKHRRKLFDRAIHLGREEGDDMLEDTLIAFKKHLYENIWMLQALS